MKSEFKKGYDKYEKKHPELKNQRLVSKHHERTLDKQSKEFSKHEAKEKALRRARLDPDYRRQVKEGIEEDKAYRSK